MAAKLKLVTILVGLLYDKAWRIAGEVLEMEAGLAEKLSQKTPPLVAFGEYVLEIDETGEAKQLAAGPTFTPPDFPGAEYLVTVGITNLDQLGEIMQSKGDNWFKGINGLGKKTAAMIADRFAALVADQSSKPAAAPAAKPKQKPEPAPEPVSAAAPEATAPAAAK